MNKTDKAIIAGSLLPFSFDNVPVRGKVVVLSNLSEFIPSIKRSSSFIQEILKQSLSTVIMLQEDLKAKNSLTLQIVSDSSIRLIVAQSLADGTIKAYAEVEKNNDISNFVEFVKHSPKMVITSDDGKNSYQSVIPLNKHSIKENMIEYYDKSVQNKTIFEYVDSKNNTCAIMLQHMPTEDISNDDWKRLRLVTETLKQDEVENVSKLEIIKRLYAEDTLRIFEEKNLNFYTSTDRQRMENALKSLGKEKVLDMLENDKLEMEDKFSGEKQIFTLEDIKNIFDNT